MKLDLPYPPTVNTYYRSIGRGRVVISARGRDYRQRVADAVMSQRCPGTTPIQCRLAVSVDFWPPDRRRRDLDNLCKSMLDAMTHAGVWGDDSQIVDLHLRMMEPCRGGRAVVEIRPA